LPALTRRLGLRGLLVGRRAVRHFDGDRSPIVIRDELAARGDEGSWTTSEFDHHGPSDYRESRPLKRSH
jgi:hypothetical protein